MKIKLSQLEKILKIFLLSYTLLLTIGVSVGLFYLANTTSMTTEGTINRFKGSDSMTDDNLGIQEYYPKPISELLITTHNHILGLGFVFLTLGLIFYFNSYINGWFKIFLMIEPMISILLTFGSLWLVRFAAKEFVYLTFISSIIMYLSFYTMSAVVTFELIFKKVNS